MMLLKHKINGAISNTREITKFPEGDSQMKKGSFRTL